MIVMEVDGTLTATEAAFVSSVSLRDVNRVIDEHILPQDFIDPLVNRKVLAAGCMLISFYYGSAKHLTAEERLLAIGRVGPKLRASGAMLTREDLFVHHDYLRIDLAPFLKSTKDNLTRLGAARAVVSVSSDILGGMPVLKGTRVPVHDVAASVALGLPSDRILAAYPGVARDQLDLARIYADAYPIRGRPRRIPAGASLKRQTSVPRRKAG